MLHLFAKVIKRWKFCLGCQGWLDIEQLFFLRNNGTLTELKNLKLRMDALRVCKECRLLRLSQHFSILKILYGNDQLLSLVGLYNADLKPEQTIDIDAGITLGLWNRVTLNAGWYRRRTKGCLVGCAYPGFQWFLRL